MVPADEGGSEGHAPPLIGLVGFGPGLEEELDDGGPAVLGRAEERRGAVGVAGARGAAGREQLRHHGGVAPGRRGVERRHATGVGGVDVGSGGQEDSDGGAVTSSSVLGEGASTGRVSSIGGGAGGEQGRRDRFGTHRGLCARHQRELAGRFFIGGSATVEQALDHGHLPVLDGREQGGGATTAEAVDGDVTREEATFHLAEVSPPGGLHEPVLRRDSAPGPRTRWRPRWRGRAGPEAKTEGPVRNSHVDLP